MLAVVHHRKCSSCSIAAAMEQCELAHLLFACVGMFCKSCGCRPQVANMSCEDYGSLQHDYVVAFAEHLLRRTAPLSETAPGDERLVRTAAPTTVFCPERSHCW